MDATQQDAFGAASVGYVGESDGWQDFNRNGVLTWGYRTAGPGNVALVGALPRSAVLALGFGSSKQAAATLAISSLMQPFDNLLNRQIETGSNGMPAATSAACCDPMNQMNWPTNSFCLPWCCGHIATRPIQGPWWRA